MFYLLGHQWAPVPYTGIFPVRSGICLRQITIKHILYWGYCRVGWSTLEPGYFQDGVRRCVFLSEDSAWELHHHRGQRKGKWELRPCEKTGQDRGGLLNMERGTACRLAFCSKSLQRMVTVGKEGRQWPHSELSSCFSWESATTGALLKTVTESASCWVCRTLLLLLYHLSVLRSGRRLGSRPSSLLCKQ